MAAAALGLPGAPLLAASPKAEVQGATPLSRALTPDGALRAHRGSFDARGYRMLLAPDGAPRFVPTEYEPPSRRASTVDADQRRAPISSVRRSAANPVDKYWSDRFGNVGAANAGSIRTVAVAGGRLYIGGSFSTLSYDSGITFNNVAMWNGRSWNPLGSGTNGEVDAIAVSGSNVYVGGRFISAGGTAASAIARWNGTRWASLGAGITDTNGFATPSVNALAVSGSNLYVAGTFDDAGTVSAHSVALWNGQSWKALSGGILRCSYFDKPDHCYSPPQSGTVSALLVRGSTLYVGGQFNYVGSVQRWSLAEWNGTGWASVNGLGVDNNNGAGSVTDIASAGSDLYIAGEFDHVGGTLGSTGTVTGATPASSVARLRRSTWSALGTGANNCPGCGNALVSSIAYWKGRLYMAGAFYGAGGDSVPHLAQWNGSTWSTVGPALDGAPADLTAGSSGVVAVGGFSAAGSGSVVLNHIGLWNGSHWTGFGLGLSLGLNAGFISALGVSNGSLYAAGYFTNAGWSKIDNIARFDGKQWNPLGAGLSGDFGEAFSIAVYGTDVFVGGSFTQAGSAAATNIAMWDGSSWHALRSGVDGTVRALLVYNGRLWVGGDFTHAGGVNADHLASWNLQTHAWAAVGANLRYDFGGVRALTGITHAPYNHYLIVGGSFSSVDDGASPSTHYLRVNGIVMFDTHATTKKPFDGYFLFHGTSKDTTGVTMNAGSGATPGGTVNALCASGLTVYVGGGFDDAGGVASHGFAVLDLKGAPGKQWASPGAVGGGDSGTVNAITKVGSTLYIAGDFTTAGPIRADAIAQFTPGSRPGAGHWTSLGSGLRTVYSVPTASALAASPSGLYVGGTFGLAGGKASENLALWTGAHT